MPPAPVNRSRIRNTVINAAPASTTNITGFLARVIGFNFLNDSFMARPAISASNSGRERASFLGSKEVRSSPAGAGLGGVIVVDTLEQPPLMHQVMLDNWAEGDRKSVV